jgi:(1->4)-alpha-D-glucan 1-alpha-D-glucosylmutase
VKQAVIARALAYRRRASNLFAAGTYLPLRIEGKMAEHALAYARIHEGRAAIAAVTRLAGRQDLAGKPLLPPSSWQGTAMLVPRNLVGRQISDVLGGMGEAAASGRVVLADLMAKLPVALLEVR